MQPTILSAAAVAAAKVLDVGLAAHAALAEPGPGDKELAAISKFLELAGLIPATGSEQKTLAALHFELHLRAFGDAFRRHWAGNKYLAPHDRDGFFKLLTRTRTERERQAEVDAAVRSALDKLVDPRDPPPTAIDALRSMTAPPTQHPAFLALWQAFAEEKPLQDSATPLILVEHGTRGEFESQFRLAYAERISSARYQRVVSYLLALEAEQGPALRQLIASDIATWGERHVFSNVLSHPELPQMSLDTMYVEPRSRLAFSRDKETPHLRLVPNYGLESGHILHQIEELLRKEPAIFVSADFGHGKSLTARHLARDTARRFLSTGTPTAESPYPVFVRCAEDFRSGGDNLNGVVSNALFRHARSIATAEDLKASDRAFDPPGDSEPTLFIIDGLDEVTFTERQLEAFVAGVHDNATSRHRFVVFSRPAGLPRPSRRAGIPVLELQPFSVKSEAEPSQAALWLEKWRQTNGTRITIREIEQRGLLEIAETPILLFMIAHTWSEHIDGTQNLATIYESFFHQIARGKHQADLDRNETVAAASEALLATLRQHGELGPDAKAPDAMLWLMARVAWQARLLEQRSETFSTHDIDEIVLKELKMKDHDDVAWTIRIGLLLTLQADLHGSSDRLLFGHKSFQEFLVARYWATVLRRVAGTPEHERAPIVRRLLGGRLLSRGDRAADFLVEIVEGWPQSEIEALVEWAERYAADSNCEFREPHRAALDEDQRPPLREAALMLATRLAERAKRTVSLPPKALHSMLPWFQLRDESPIIVAPGARLKSAFLKGSPLANADFSGADLSGADLRRADLSGARFVGADLSGAVLGEAKLSGADLTGANLSSADLSGCDLDGAILVENTFDDQTRLAGTSSREARLDERAVLAAHADGADLYNLSNLLLDCAQLQGIALDAATLSGCAFVAAGLSRAKFAGAVLRNVDFSKANLERANFSKAILERVTFDDASLEGAEFANAELDAYTLVQAARAGAKLRDCRATGELKDVSFVGARLDGVDLGGCRIIDNALFSRASLQDTVWAVDRMGVVDFQEADLGGAVFRRFSMGGVLSGDDAIATVLNLQGAKLDSSSLQILIRTPEIQVRGDCIAVRVQHLDEISIRDWARAGAELRERMESLEGMASAESKLIVEMLAAAAATARSRDLTLDIGDIEREFREVAGIADDQERLAELRRLKAPMLHALKGRLFMALGRARDDEEPPDDIA